MASTILGLIVLRRQKTIESQVKSRFDEAFKIFESRRAWKQQALAELFGPLQMQLERSKRAFSRWDGKNLYLEAKVVREANQTMLQLLLAKGHLIPPHLMNDAALLVEHFDAWLEAFDGIRNQTSDGEQPSFVFVGPQGYPFPSEAEIHFRREFLKLQTDLYGDQLPS